MPITDFQLPSTIPPSTAVSTGSTVEPFGLAGAATRTLTQTTIPVDRRPIAPEGLAAWDKRFAGGLRENTPIENAGFNPVIGATDSTLAWGDGQRGPYDLSGSLATAPDRGPAPSEALRKASGLA